jgi:hypothetical protein
LANIRKLGINVQNGQDDVKRGASRMELFIKYENMKFWWWQLPIFTESLTIGRIEYKIPLVLLSAFPEKNSFILEGLRQCLS